MVKADTWEVLHCKSFKCDKLAFFAGGGGNDPHPASSELAIWGISLRYALVSLRGLNVCFIACSRVIFMPYRVHGVQGTRCLGEPEGNHTPQRLRKIPARPSTDHNLNTTNFTTN